MAALGAVCCRGMLAGGRSTVLCVAGAPTGQSHAEGPSSSSRLAGSLQRPLSAEPVVALQAGKKKERQNPAPVSQSVATKVGLD